MEEELRSPLNLVDYFRDHHAQLDHWYYDEESFVHRDVNSEPVLLSSFREVETGLELDSWERRRPVGLPGKIFFVDGRMRVYGRILLGMETLLLGEIIAGHAIWEKESGLSMGFSPHYPPERRRILGVSQPLALTWQQEGTDPRIGLEKGIDFFPEGSERDSHTTREWDPSQQALFNALRKLEKKVVGQLISQGVPLIQDGTVHANDPVFRTNVGPMGLVKRIENFRLPLAGNTLQVRQMLFELDRGERTPFFGAFFNKGSVLQRVFTYTRLVERDDQYPLKGLVRCEVVIGEDISDRFKADITSFFDRTVSLLPQLTGDYPWRRLPENIFPMIALEDHLGQFFLSPDRVRNSFRRVMKKAGMVKTQEIETSNPS